APTLAIGGIAEGEARAWLARQGVAVPAGVEFLGPLPRERWTALVAGAGVYVSAARYEDWGLAQMEALAAGVPLVTVPTAGANVALPLARELAPALVAADCGADALAAALRAGLALAPAARSAYADRAAALMEPYSDAAQRRLVAEEILPALLGSRP
ncbi:MAG: glycosyltransferase, partial [Solirubrobacterales bacterium]|nr:glycosyltransferase [Solirubrobacterales bacterium]